ncbi:sensor histidine kinase [Streptomyces buecherae]|uniref:sensor histidine kinase n=2 Tax=Streptomyces TaxID=1883 RepID=UPI001C25258B|nr:histidine kinase [Streptomyces buecherae]
MRRTDDRLLPALLLGAQVVVWPGAAWLRGGAPSGADLLAAALVGGLVTVALAIRRARPVPVLVLVAAGCAIGAQPLPTGALAVLGSAGVALALFSVAVEREATTAWLCVGTLALWQLAHGLSLHGLGDSQGLDLVWTALLYAAATGAGRYARRARAARRAAEARLRRASAERHRLPAAERRRMERELHDVSAHHLTAVVVTVEAALGLRERRPELAREALTFAAETGREVTRALGAVRAPAPSPQDHPAPRERLRELVAGFRALGQPVTVEAESLPDGVLGDTAYGIVREALTNAVRHAPGAATTVRCAHGDSRTDIVVRNAPPTAPGPGTPPGRGLGGGRGQHLLRGRAREAGGTLTSGPTRDGGWEVRAVLPGRTSAAPVTAAVPRSYRVAQYVTAVALCLQPLLPTLIVRDEPTSADAGGSAGALFALLATAQVLTLWWLRRAPRATLAALLALAPLWPVAMATGGYAGPVLLPPLLGTLATGLALAAVAARAPGHAGPLPRAGVRDGLTGVGALAGRALALPRRVVPFVAAGVHATVALAAVLAARSAGQGDAAGAGGHAVGAGWALAGVGATGAALVCGAAWAGGTWYGRRRRVASEAHQDRVAAWTEEAVRDAWAERRRIAVGLETTVLARTADVVEAAEAGRLAQTADRARDALAAMRALLDTVRVAEARAERRPQPTLQALDLLVHQCQATGRQVRARLTDRVPERLPAAVDIAAYRAAETILRAGGDEPAELVLDATDHVLTLTATGVPHATRPASRERLAARADALGGGLTVTGPDALVLRLPLPAPLPAPAPATTGPGDDHRPPATHAPLPVADSAQPAGGTPHHAGAAPTHPTNSAQRADDGPRPTTDDPGPAAREQEENR